MILSMHKSLMAFGGTFGTQNSLLPSKLYSSTMPMVGAYFFFFVTTFANLIVPFHKISYHQVLPAIDIYDSPSLSREYVLLECMQHFNNNNTVAQNPEWKIQIHLLVG